ncbi:MAG TPA: MSMEG_1061 family FMN-dependent PPOX-type flavoprotein [Myxococcota bacterium]|nr:MSMEG_1061 family FMN-dependent PPOX-type flavoprotein [Myxococcota bacterium]
MANYDMRITSLDELRALIDEPHPVTRQKVFDALDDQMQAFIARAPFLVLATAGADGRLEVSPKGDAPGFVKVEDERTLLVPDRKGNKLLFGLQNVLANPQVSLIFLVPATDETLRVSGRAELYRDPALLELLATRGQPALVALRVRIERCFFHCARAFLRASLWDPASWPEPGRVSFGRQMAPKLGGGDALAAQIDRAVDEGRGDL